MKPDRDAEWLEADGLGGFASGTTGLVRTRRYHALLLCATEPPAGRMVLVNGVEAWVERDGTTIPITTQRYAPGVDHPDGARRLVRFEPEPWPTWTFDLDGRAMTHEVFVPRDHPLVVLRWSGEGTLHVRPLLSGRDFHATHHENDAFRFEEERDAGAVRFRPYAGVPAVLCGTNGDYRAEPQWYRRFLYGREQERGLDAEEDLASPGVFSFDLARGDAVLVMALDDERTRPMLRGSATAIAGELGAVERARRAAFPSRLARSADAYLVRRGDGTTVIAGYPWFGDWGRDTFIALRGLCLATGRHDAARDVLLAWSCHVRDGLLPNRFPDRGAEPEYNSVDASLWYVIAAAAYLPHASPSDRSAIEAAIVAIVGGMARGTRFGIHLDDDGLLAAGEPGSQLTWMDARVRGVPVTPRIGKPVEVQALWLNALRIAEPIEATWSAVRERGEDSFAARFWNEAAGCLFDVVDVDHHRGRADATIRPNQILAIGGLPHALLDGVRARAVVDTVERQLWTPVGLRSLSPDDPRYTPRYTGGPGQRDAAYHQGTVWPFLVGPFVDAWARVRGDTDAARAEARREHLEPLLATLDRGGVGHLSEIADAEPPHALRGCPFQAWSLAEVLRVSLEGGARAPR